VRRIVLTAFELLRKDDLNLLAAEGFERQVAAVSLLVKVNAMQPGSAHSPRHEEEHS